VAVSTLAARPHTALFLARVTDREGVRSVTFTGITTDVPVSDLAAARTFYRAALGRVEDLTPRTDTLEWILHDRPQVAVRIVAQPSGAGSARVGIGVDDLSAERERLETTLDTVPEISAVPGVIALLELRDGDGNALVFWQDLLPRAPEPAR
jgi:catechol 2,3-dioxygenase-like lactoylglutathione lyase family enzyme